MRQRSDRPTRAAGPLVALAIALAPGCDSGPGFAVGDAPPRDLPSEISKLLPRGSEVVYQEGTEADVTYHLWIIRAEPGPGIAYPKSLPGFERHELPGLVLANLLKAKTPSIANDSLYSTPCHYTHWDGPQVEYRVREARTVEGWVAAVEQFRKTPGAPGDS